MRSGATGLCGAVFVAVLASGCGAKSPLELSPPDGGGVDAGRAECLRDEDCEDGVECTRDSCEARRCVYRGEDAACEDGLFCPGPGRCDVTLGCVYETNPCDDGVACTEDLCEERLDQCRPTPDASRCPLSHRCDPVLGCVARALAHDTSGILWEVDLPSGVTTRVADTRLPMTDLALHPDGRAFGISTTSLFRIDAATGETVRISDLEEQVALDVHPDGALVSAGGADVLRVDPETGASERIGRFPAGFEASGDIAFVRGRMLVTGTTRRGAGGPPDVLFEVPGDGGELTRVGDVGIPCVWALAPFGDTLYGLDCSGQLLDVDPVTGAGRVLRNVGPIVFGGAAAR